MKLNLLKLVTNLNMLQPEDTSDGLISDYLKNDLLPRLLSDDPIQIKDVDFNAFTEEELVDLEGYLRELSDLCSKSSAFTKVIASAKTQTSSLPMFC